ncbi:hypothetical protein [Dactylosporangium sp. CA-233914]
MPNSPVTWDQPDEELDDLTGPDAELLSDDPDQPSETDFFWEDEEE